MIHPRNLLRTDSNGNNFAAPMGNYMNDMDCGVMAFPWIAKFFKLEKLARLGVFVGALAFLGFVHGIVVGYFRGTSHLWSLHYRYSKYTVGWIIYGNEIFAGIFALCVAYWGNRIHRATWMGALTIFLSISSLTLAIPEIYNPFTAVEINSTLTGPPLCGSNSDLYSVKPKRESDEVTMGIFVVFLANVALAQTSFITHGLTYIDDHTSPGHSPAFIGLVIAATEIGKQIGIYCSWTPYGMRIDRVFVSPVWLGMGLLTFTIGSLMTLFPETLPNILMMKSVDSLVSMASGLPCLVDNDTVDGFFKTVWRLIKNKILLINTFSFVLIESALINFRLLEKYFNQSKYHVSIERDTSGYNDPEIIQFTSNLLMQPLFAMSLLTAGMLLSKMRPKAKHLIIWNIVAFLLMAVIFSSSVFYNCTTGLRNENKNAITIPYCSSKCACKFGEPFKPVCVDGRTYFSPCLAGCKAISSASNLYRNCTCGKIVTEGSCDEKRCRIPLAIGQANGILSNGIFATTLIPHILINMRSVQDKDKAPALGLGLTFLQIIPYVPVRLIYQRVADDFCKYRTAKGCQYYSESFPTFLSITTIVMMILAAISCVVLLFFINDLPLYTAKRYASSADLEARDIRLLEISEQDAPSDSNPVRNLGRKKMPTSNEESPFVRHWNRRNGSRPMFFPKNQNQTVEAVVEDVVTSPPPRASSRSKTPTKSADVSLGESLEAIANEIGDPTSDNNSKKSLENQDDDFLSDSTFSESGFYMDIIRGQSEDQLTELKDDSANGVKPPPNIVAEINL